MKRKTYNNVIKATKMLVKKGYDFNEASQLALNIFDTHENEERTIEYYINKVLSKQDWIAEQERYEHDKRMFWYDERGGLMIKLELTQDEFNMLVYKLKWMRCVVRDSNLNYKNYCDGNCNSGCNRRDLLSFEEWLRSKVITQ